MTKKKAVEELSFLSRMPQDNNPLAEAIMISGAISKSHFAEMLGLGKVGPNGKVTGARQSVSEWFRSGSIPKGQALAIHKLTKGKVSLERLLSKFDPYKPEKSEKGAAVAEEKTAEEVAPAVVVPAALAKKPRAKKAV